MPTFKYSAVGTDGRTVKGKIEASSQGELVEELRRLLRPGVPIVVGGQPFAIVPDLSARLGADAAAVDGGSASAVVSRLLGRPPRAGA